MNNVPTSNAPTRQVMPYDNGYDRLVDYLTMALSRVGSVPRRERSRQAQRVVKGLEEGRLGPLFALTLDLMDEDAA